MQSSPIKGPNAGYKADYPSRLCADTLESAFDSYVGRGDIFDRIFGELRELHVDEMFGSGGASLYETVETARFIKHIIKIADKLECLTIEYISGFETERLSLFQGWEMKHLQYLELHHMDVTLNELVGFARSHARTIVEVQFRSVRCRNAKWVEIVENMREFSYPRLRSFVAWDCRREYWGEDVEDGAELGNLKLHDYLLRRTDDNPAKPSGTG